MISSTAVLLMALAPVAAYVAGVLIINGVRALAHRIATHQPYSRKALPSG
ncbi:hypothetical protein OCL06_01945 [Alteromonas sp. ASW11-19]|uniref:Uncharacterized protein n=1 Tax=Alteromonas salexigens TaxID=2982530 RepID=A0ABT2VJF1_9ALTE|nr:hypothetical protein [Alteromonas salexigens]MCU7553355.1 hypothetical protein [Alteromonas salexigens]